MDQNNGDLVPTPIIPGPGLTVDHHLLDVAYRAMAPATRRALRADLRVFTDWAQTHAIAAPPVAPLDLARFIRDKALAGRKIATISRYVSSIATWHKLLKLPNPAVDPLVRLELKAQRRSLGVRQRQASGLRFRGEVSDPILAVGPVGVCVEAMLAACGEDLAGMRDRALLSLAYDTGLRRSEIVAVDRQDVAQGSAKSGRLFIPRTKTDREAKGGYAYLSPRTMAAMQAWFAAGSIDEGRIFRRLHRAKTKEDASVWTVGAGLTAQSVTLIYRSMLNRAHEAGLLGMIDPAEFEVWRQGLSAHSTRVGLTQDLFAAGQDLGGIMHALRWKSPAQPARYAEALSAEANAAARVVGKL